MLQYKIIPVTPFQQNCTLFWCDETMEAAIVDPGGDFSLLVSEKICFEFVDFRFRSIISEGQLVFVLLR